MLIRTLLLAAVLCLTRCGEPGTPREEAVAGGGSFPCPASPDWVTKPNPPSEIPGGGTDFCQFYQFSWQWFLALVSPAESGEVRTFQVSENYPVLRAEGDSRARQSDEDMQGLFVRLQKSDDPSAEFIIPERVHQAGDQATIYDQSGNVAYYDIRFSRNMCDVPEKGDFPPGTTEIKTAWRVMGSSEGEKYFTMDAVINDIPVSLGLIGFHLVRNTADHPEFVWASFEHGDNAPDCLEPLSAPAAGWSFTSDDCEKCLEGSAGCESCSFNKASPAKDLHGTPTEICQVYHDGTGPNDNKAQENIAVVNKLNEQLVGADGILTKLSSEDPMAVWQNYINIGALWVSDPKQSANAENQRGSLQLANSVMETTFQGTFQSGGSGERGSATNCFACHDYKGANVPTTDVSHIFDDIVKGKSTDSTE